MKSHQRRFASAVRVCQKRVLSLLWVFCIAGFLPAPAHADTPPTFVAAWNNDNWIQLGPRGIATDAAGNFYISGDYAIQKFDGTGKFLAQWGTKGDGDVQVLWPQGLAVDGAGNLYVADTGNARILKYDSNGNYLMQWGTEGSGDGQFSKPGGSELGGIRPEEGIHSIALDSAGNVYVADSGTGPSENASFTISGRIQKFDGNGKYLAQWGTIGGANSQFRSPTGLAIDALGNVYVGDSRNFRIQKFDLNGKYLDQWGTPGDANGQFADIQGMAVDKSGYLYVMDSANNRIQKFDGNGKYLTQWGTGGKGDGEFSSPSFHAFDNAGNIFVTDTGNNRVQKFSYSPAFNRTLTISKTGNGAIVSDPPGIDCGTNCSASFQNGTSVTLTATAADGFRFSGWGGACTGTGKCVLTMDAAKDASATFVDSQAPATVSLTVSKSGNGTVTSTPVGINCGTACSASFDTGTSVTLSAAPAAGYKFSGWGGVCSGTGPCVVTMDSAKSASATFVDSQSPNNFTLNISKSGAGIVTSTPAGIDCGSTCSASFASGGSVTLTATPADGYIFNGWSGACNGTGQCVVKVNANKIVIAQFGPPVIPPSVTANIPSNTAFVKQPFEIGWQLGEIKKGRPVRVKFAKDGGPYRIIKSTQASATGIGVYRWKPKTAQRTENGLIQICAVPTKGGAEVCSAATAITVQ
jgi:sugar lactone lactonase YvrE